MKTTLVKTSEIKPNPDNPRIIRDDKFAKLVESIRSFPSMLHLRPIVVNTDMVVLGGNMRLRACKEAGMKHIPVIVAEDITEAQQREFIIKDNVGFGEWNWDTLANEWEAAQLEDWGMDIPKFDTEDQSDEDEKPKAYNVQVMCDNQEEQFKFYEELTAKGYLCKI